MVTRRAIQAGQRVGAQRGAAAGLATEGAIEGAAAGLGASIRQLANDEAELGSMEFIRAAGEAAMGAPANIASGAALGAGLGGAAGAVLGNPRVANWLNDWSDASWLRSTGAAIPRARAEAFGGQGAAAVGANTRRYGLVQTGSGADNSLEAIRNRATTLRTEAEMAMGRAANSPSMQYISIPVKNVGQLQAIVGDIGSLATSSSGDVARVAVRANNILRNVAQDNVPIRAFGMHASTWTMFYMDDAAKRGVYQLADSGEAGAASLKEALRQARISMSRSIDDALVAGTRRVVRTPGARGVAGKVPRSDRAKVQEALQDSFEKYNTASAVLEMTRRTDPTMFNTVWSVIPWGRLGPMGSAIGQAGRAAGVRQSERQERREERRPL